MQIREMIGLPPNLPPCLGVTSHMLIGPHSHSSSKISPASVPKCYSFLSDYTAVVDQYGDEIPNWFNHQSNGNSISFLIGPEFPTIAVCVSVAIEMIKDDCRFCNFNLHVVISINGSKRLFESTRIIFARRDQLVFCCRLQSSLQILFEDLNLGDRNLVQIFCETSYNNTGKIASQIKSVGVHVDCICSPQKSQKVSKMRNRPLESSICTCLCLAQTHCQCPKQLCSTYSTGPTSVNSGYSNNHIISSAMDGGGSSSVSLSSNSGLSMDVTNGSEFDFGFQSTLGDGVDMGSSSLNDDSDFSPYPQSKKMRPS